MPHGIQTWDASGNPIIDSSTWTGQVLGSFSLGANHAGGSLVDVGLTKGRPFAFALASQGIEGATAAGNPVNIALSVSGSTLSWSAAPAACQVIYGIY